MELKHQVGIGVSLTIGSLLLFYIMRKPKQQKDNNLKQSKARTLISKYKPKPSAEDIIEDNNFKDRIVEDNKVSEGGIVYHDIRYPTDDNNMANKAEVTHRSSELEDNRTPVIDTMSITPLSSEPVVASADNVELPSAVDSNRIEGVNEISIDKSDNDNWDVPDNNLSLGAPASIGGMATASSGGMATASNAPDNNMAQASNGHYGTTETESNLTKRLVTNGINGDIPTTENVVRAVVAAKDRFEMDMRQESANQEIIQQCFPIPSRAVGKIIGKGGNTIKSITRESGAKLRFPQSRDRASSHQKLYVTGTLNQVTEAVSRLRGLMPSDSVCHEIISWTQEQALSGDLRPLDLIENTLCIGRVTHVTSPHSIWIQISRGTTGTDYNTMLTNLTTNITETLGRRMYDLKNALLQPAQIKQGAACAVMLEGRAWRARVMCPGTPDNNVHQVRLVDFGTPHSFTELFQLSNYFMSMPALAVQCSLAHLSKLDEDPAWPEEAAAYLEEKLAEGYVKVKTVVADTVSSVELYIETVDGQGSMYLNRELVLDGYAKWDEQ